MKRVSVMSALGRIAVAAVVSLALATAALAQKSAPESPAVWARKPTSEQYRQARPPEAVKQGGRALVRCRVDDGGMLSACVTLRETPAASGYGAALASLAPLFQMKLDQMKREAPDGSTVLVDSSFDFDKGPDWLRKPRSDDLLTVWPTKAWAKSLGGRAVINCLVSVQGALFDCVPTMETPPGEHFGAAAVALTPQLLMRPALYKGHPVISTLDIPINFQMEAGAGGTNIGHKTATAAMAWSQAPSYADMAAAYPKKARESHLSGRATVNCSFAFSGALTDCMAISEEPKGAGFATAAQKLARQFRAPAAFDAKMLKTIDVQIPFTFDLSILTDDPPAIGKPEWVALPNVTETAAAFDTVTKSGVGGTVRVTLKCTVQPGGEVAGCAVTREDPAGAGVGLAALSLAPHFKITTWTIEGLPTVGGTVSIPLRYEGGAKDTAPPAKP